MKNTLLLCLLSITTWVDAQTPSLEQVLSFVHSTVSVNPIRGTYEIQKKPEGYFLCTTFYDEGDEGKTVNCQQIWSPATAQFIKPEVVHGFNSLKYEPNKEESIHYRFGDIWLRRTQNASLRYYGYPGWIKDTQDEINAMETPSAADLEALARSYASEANEYIHPGIYGLEGKNPNSYKDAGYGKIEQERVDGFRTAFAKALNTWKRIAEIDPNYVPFFIHDIRLKTSNEYMHGYFTASCIKEDELASLYLNQANYEEVVLNYARNFLDQCATNSILLTNGDTDTYPLWYVQEKFGYRKDVAVINMSLGQTAWYQEYVLDKYQLRSSFSAAVLGELYTKYFLFGSEEREDLAKWLQVFLTTRNTDNPLIKEEEYYVYVDGNWLFKRKDGSYQVDKDRYVHSHMVFFYDLFEQNPEREIVTTSYYSFKDLGLAKYAFMDQHVVRLVQDTRAAEMDSKKSDKIIATITDFKKDQFEAGNKWSDVQRSINLNLAQQVDGKRSAEIIPLVEEKVLNGVTHENTDFDLASAISDFYMTFSSKANTAYLETYDPYAIQLVGQFKLNPSTCFDDLQQFYSLLSMYTGNTVYRLRSISKDDYEWLGSNALYFALNAKLNELESTCSDLGLSLSLKKVNELQEIVKRCKIQ